MKGILNRQKRIVKPIEQRPTNSHIMKVPSYRALALRPSGKKKNTWKRSS